MDYKVPFAELNNRCVTPDEVPEGCKDLTCPGCGLPLIVKKGNIRVHHFAHANGGGGISCGETAIHKMAKQILTESSYMILPRGIGRNQFNQEIPYSPGRFRYQKAIQEHAVYDIIPDVIIGGLFGVQTVLCVEIFVNHKVPEDKIKKYKQYHLNSIEIDLSDLPSVNLNPEELKTEIKQRVIDGCSKKEWLNLYIPMQTVAITGLSPEEVARRRFLATHPRRRF